MHIDMSAQVGHDDNKASDAWGISTAFPIWAQFMNNIPQSLDKLSFDVPDDIEWRFVDSESGKPYALSDAPPEISLLKEAYLLGTAPAFEEEDDAPRTAPVVNNQGVFAP